jgi:hypothetical protein
MHGNYTQSFSSNRISYVTKAELDRRLEEQRKQIREELVKELTEDFMAQLNQIVQLKDA